MTTTVRSTGASTSSRSGVFTSSASVTSTISTTTEEPQSSHGAHHLSSPHSVPHTSVAEQVEKVEALEKDTDKGHHHLEVKPVEHVAYVDKSDLVVLEVRRLND